MTSRFCGSRVCGTLWTPVKVNLALHVTGRRSDGYHLLDSLVCFSQAGDLLSYDLPLLRTPHVEKKDVLAPRVATPICPQSDYRYPSHPLPQPPLPMALELQEQIVLSITGPFSDSLGNAQENLLFQAVDLAREVFLGGAENWAFSLNKLLPLASGIGGGSGDAAAALYILWEQGLLPCTLDALARLVLPLGADIPMCLYGLAYGQALRAQGIGEVLTRLDLPTPLALVLVNCGVEIKTPAVFAQIKSCINDPLSLPSGGKAFLSVEEMVAFLQKTRNDLYLPALALVPLLDEVLQALEAQGACFARMSGSGATCFGIFTNKLAADKAARAIKHACPHWFVQSLMTMAPANKKY